MDRGAWWATVHAVIESDMAEVTEHILARCDPIALLFPQLFFFFCALHCSRLIQIVRVSGIFYE